MVETFISPAGHVITALQLLVAATSYGTEANPATRAQYSKFSQADNANCASTWPSKLAMMVIYTPAAITSALLLLGSRGATGPWSISPTLALLFCTLHMTKRCLEVLFLHKYSGRTDRVTPTAIGMYYALTVLLIARAASDGNADRAGDGLRMTTGSVLFGLGIAGNLYHHYLLAGLRSAGDKGATSKYVAPRGGLFAYVATPHYLFEIVGWLGIAIVANHLNAFLVVASMSSYLGGRSVAQNDFNRSAFNTKDWPLERKNLVPFLF